MRHFRNALPTTIVFNAVALVALASIAYSQPQARSCHAAAYAARIGGTAVFGGARECGVGVLADDTLWLWNGTQWSVLAHGGPSAREDAMMIYDTKRDALVLFGGRRDGRIFTDTWEWKRASGWRNVAPSVNPGTLEHAAITFDSLRGRAVLFGGAGPGGFQSTTWEWDGANWTKMNTPASPTARIGHSLTWDPSTQSIAMYGGFSPSKLFNDFWRWNGERWTLVDSAGPTHSEGASLVFGKQSLTVIGPGLTEAKTLRVWNYVGGKWVANADARSLANAASLLVGANATFDSRRGVVVVSGGGPTAAARIRVAEFDGVSWRVVP